MKTRKLLDKLSDLISGDSGQKKTEIEGLEEVLKKLKKRQRKLEGQLEAASEGKAKRLKKEIKVLKAQRKKGAARLAELVGSS
jgi:chromosome segregation ATPase